MSNRHMTCPTTDAPQHICLAVAMFLHPDSVARHKVESGYNLCTMSGENRTFICLDHAVARTG